MPGVWVLGKDREHMLELITAASPLVRELSVPLTALAPDGDRELAYDCTAYGCQKAYVLPRLAADQAYTDLVGVMAKQALQDKPDVILISSSGVWQEVASRLAARLDAGMYSDGIDLDQAAGIIRIKRLVYGGSAVQIVAGTTRPLVVTIPPGIFAPAERVGDGAGELIELPEPEPSNLKIAVLKETAAAAQKIEQARVLVCVGRGFEKEEDLSLARELAEVLGGQLVCTRPLAEELHWMPANTYIGLSGLQVKPDLYIGLGVSGQIQHITGISESRVIFAVNRDENAPIFQVADYGIVGDLYQVVPELITQFRKLRA